MILVYSKDRAMQLHATLYSLGLQDDIIVLYKTEDYQHQYDILMSVFPDVVFIAETDLVAQTKHLLHNAEYVLFLVDDTIFTRYVNTRYTFNRLKGNNNVLGFSLRLGKNITHSHIYNKPLPHPRFKDSDGSCYTTWTWTLSELEWGNPLTVDATAYRCRDISYLLSDCPPGDPGMIEGHMAAERKKYIPSRPCMYCFKESVAFCTPVNTVRDKTICPFGREHCYSVLDLANEFDNGWRIDTTVLPPIISPHQEIAFTFKKG